MTPDSAHEALIEQLEKAGLTECPSPLGVTHTSTPLADRSFAVLPVASAPVGDRGQAERSGFRWRADFTVELVHQPAPSAGTRGASQMMRDTHEAIRRIVQPATSLTQEGNVGLGRATHTIAGGGAYWITRIPVDVTFNLSLQLEDV